MKKSIKNIVMNTVLIMGLSLQLSYAAETNKKSPLKDTHVVAKVNNKEIKVIDIKEEYLSIPESQRSSIDKLFIPIRDTLINRYAVVIQAEKDNIDKQEKYKSAVETYKSKLLVDMYFNKKGVNNISDNDLKKEYEVYKNVVKNNYQIKLSHILVKTRLEANKIIESLNSGEDFGELAKERSIGPSSTKKGDLGYVSRGQMVPEFEKAAFKLKNNTYTKRPVKTKFGWHVIKRFSNKKSKILKFSKIKKKLENIIRIRQINKIVSDSVSKVKITVYDVNGKEVK